ncbi:MAG: 16S rRNA (uracil(1498)-N(3))-methyltransferase [Pseudomonadota bacterium]
MAPSTIRLYVEQRLGRGQIVPLSRDQAHYLFNVMRLTEGAQITAFDGQSGVWSALLAGAAKRQPHLSVIQQTDELRLPPDLWLLFAPIKKARTDFIVEKATELGVRRICPVQTQHTNSERIRRDRLQAHAIEAAEQCGGSFVPPVDDIAPLERVLDNWPSDRHLLFCDEDLAGGQIVIPLNPGPWAILIGPEGGFSSYERDRLTDLTYAHPTSLGPRILRADTATVAAISLWQDRLGDWQGPLA